MSTLHSLFNWPATKRVGRLNLNAGAVNLFAEEEPNPLMDPHFCAAWVEHLHRTEKLDFSYGGYLEDRAFLWRDSYLDQLAAVHLGVDVNVPAWTKVYAPCALRIEECFVDGDQNGGWGERLVAKRENGELIVFAHLCETTPIHGGDLCWVNRGDALGFVAPPERNGGWYPHLHLEGLRSRDQLVGLDGYGPARPDNATLYPEPLALLGITP